MTPEPWDPPQQWPSDEAAGALTVDPFNSLAAHYGMLLGVPDFQIIGANPRGRHRLHQAWQHYEGVIWGYRVSLDTGVIKVSPGLATDRCGYEIASDADLCLDVGAWFDKRLQSDKGFTPRGGPSHYEFGGRVWVSHAACLTRRVPSVSSSCTQADDSVQFSRVHEFGRVSLEPYRPDDDACGRPPVSGDVVDESDPIDSAYAGLRALIREGRTPDQAGDPQSWLQAFRTVAATASSQLAPPGYRDGDEGTRLFPVNDPDRVLLAELPRIVLDKVDGRWEVTIEAVDLSRRRTHLPTVLIEELVVEAMAAMTGSAPISDAGGPRVVKIGSAGRRITIDLTRDVVESCIADSVSVRLIDRAAAAPRWSGPLPLELSYQPATIDAPARITATVPAADGDLWYRVRVRGTGPTPLVGLSDGHRLVPLAGRVGGPSGTEDDGHDVVATIRRDGA